MMTKFYLPTLMAAVLAITMSAAPVAAQGNSQGKGPPTGKGAGAKQERSAHDGGDAGDRLIDAAFSAVEISLIQEYFGTHQYQTSSLPPGIAKNLARGKPLPPGIAKKALPGDLQGRLPGRHGYDRIIAGNDVLLVKAATGVIVDILRGAL
ncbi:anti-virulence regulator CigR family protein [Fodinicurvata fenggangensis]|uniref:anti-virulence regulator CigR family protein n=1 Tax=Fodinicurvata fenggangensis TaxID=1121830 RepID=UPI0006894127|nr:anti-virulence regulator CigR family protein [Fodinicurvata fenggangensis]